MKYYTLCIKRSNRWEAEFGDYDKEIVQDEAMEHEGVKTKIVSSGDSQEEINQAIAKLNQ